MRTPPSNPAAPGPATLSARQFDVLLLLARGCTDRAIAEHLAIGLRTAETHVAGILAKLGAESRVSAVVAALRRGLIELPPEE